jgi:hypothetical protein
MNRLNITELVNHQVFYRLKKQIQGPVNKQIIGQVNFFVEDTVRNNIRNQIETQVYSQVISQLFTQIRNNLKK